MPIDIPWVMYQIYIYAAPIIILAALAGFRWKAGLWGNSVTLGVVLFSILVAVGWWEDVAELLAGQATMTLFVADCIAIWTLFIVTLVILDTATRFMSTVKVKYNDIVDNVGNGIVLILLFLAVYGFFLFTEELGPVGEHDDAEQPGNSVAIQMLQILSARSEDGESPVGNLSPFTQGYQFDDRGDFRQLQMQRRQAIMHGMMSGGESGGSIRGDDAPFGEIERRGRK